MSPRDVAFVGLHSSGSSAEEDLDPYGTLREKTWCADEAQLLRLLDEAHTALLAAAPSSYLPERPGLNPVAWTIGHVAFTFDSLVAHPLTDADTLRRVVAWAASCWRFVPVPGCSWL